MRCLIPHLLALVRVLFILLNVRRVQAAAAARALGPAQKWAQMPFISIPIVKSNGPFDANLKQLGPLGTAARALHYIDVMKQVYRRHVNRGVRRLMMMSGAQSAPVQAVGAPTDKLKHTAGSWERAPNARKRSRAFVPELTQDQTSDPADDVLGENTSVWEDKASVRSINAPAENETVHESESEVTKATPTDSHSAGMDIEGQDIGYLVKILIGTPPRNFSLLVDSGSGDMWAGGENCRGEEGGACGDHTFLGNTSSSSFTDTGTLWSIIYGSGNVNGTLVRDYVAVAGCMLSNHTFGVTRFESAQFTDNDNPLDGILGTAKQSLSMQQTPTLLNALATAGLIAKRIISYKISRLSDGKNDGEVTLGAMDPSKYDRQSLVRVPNVSTGGFWEAKLDAMKVNGKDVGLVGRSCIFDTGTTLIIAPKPDVDAIHRFIPSAVYNSSANGWTIPCNTTTLVSLVFGGKSFTIQPQDLVFLSVDPDDATALCTSAIVEGGVSADPTGWLAGDTLLKNVYLSTDEDNDEISIARLVIK
ncbi:aspartic peptidase A1 [Mycena pura]|uniref:Aspartic peptidase A1 n=1 Tax=Mycena pura TaxID=153505 RepID=A0AAD6YIN5_9AGAR|nr:aspartic peptidase A1 [Mycena pura]